jgi:hypothetical protein
MKQDKRFSLAARVVGGVCALGVIAVLIVFAVAGFGLISGLMLAASLTGLFVPAVVAGGSLLEMLEAVVELFAEGIGTLLEAIAEFFASIFG